MTTPKSVQPAPSVATSDGAGNEPTPILDEAIQGALGRKLRESYEEVVKEQVPDKFLQLLDQLKGAESTNKVRES